MRLFRLPEPLPRDACRKTGVLPPRPSRGRDFSTEPHVRTRIEDPHERLADGSLRRGEKYVAAVMMAAAISAALMGTARAAGVAGDAGPGGAPYAARPGC